MYGDQICVKETVKFQQRVGTRVKEMEKPVHDIAILVALVLLVTRTVRFGPAAFLFFARVALV